MSPYPDPTLVKHTKLDTEPATARPRNRRTHHHVTMELRCAEQRVRCLKLRLEGQTVRQVAQEVGVSPSTVNGYIQSALRDSRAASAHLGAQIREQERVRLQAVIDRWHPVATGPHRTREAARAAELVRKSSEALRGLVADDLATIKWTRGCATTKHNRNEHNAKQVWPEI